MNTTISTPYEWLKALSPSLLKLEDIPLFGYSPKFPWKSLGEQLSQTFHKEGIIISSEETAIRSKEELYKGLEGDLIPLHLSVSPIKGTLCWVMKEGDISILMSILLADQPQVPLELNPEYRNAFYQFLAGEIINTIGRLEFDQALSPQIIQKEKLPNEDALCQDIKIKIQQKELIGRFIISPEFSKSWKEHYSLEGLHKLDNPELAEKIKVKIHLEGGKTHLSLQEWKNVKVGDYVILEECSIEPETNKGRLVLTVNGVPVFRGKIKDGEIKILENPLYHEEDTTMNKFPEDSEDEEFEFGENDEFEDEEFTDTDLEDLEEEEPSVEEGAEEKLEEEEEEEEEKEEVAEKVPVEKATPPIKPDDVPLNIVVEVGRIQMSLSKVMDLQPGNLLDLKINPEEGVSLVINGQIVAKGELLKIGETLGVRVLEIGK